MEQRCLTDGGLILERLQTAQIQTVSLKDLDLEEETGLPPSEGFPSGRSQSPPGGRESTKFVANTLTVMI